MVYLVMSESGGHEPNAIMSIWLNEEDALRDAIVLNGKTGTNDYVVKPVPLNKPNTNGMALNW